MCLGCLELAFETLQPEEVSSVQLAAVISFQEYCETTIKFHCLVFRWLFGCSTSSALQPEQGASVLEPSEDGPACEPSSSEETEGPGPINNADLFLGDSLSAVPKDGLEEGKDFVLLSAEAWKHLTAMYGGGPELRLPVVKASGSEQTIVEFPPPKVTVYLGSDKGRTAEIFTSIEVRFFTASLLILAAC